MKHFNWNDISPTDNTSSTINISGLTFIAHANASLANIPDEYVFTGWYKWSPISAKSIISCSLAFISSFVNPITCPCWYIFSYPVNSWLNAVPNSKSELIFPLASIVPFVGVTTPVIIFNNVDFPAPFFPKTPSTSPFFTSKLKSCIASNTPCLSTPGNNVSIILSFFLANIL